MTFGGKKHEKGERKKGKCERKLGNTDMLQIRRMEKVKLENPF
jgi:hypothetical protein